MKRYLDKDRLNRAFLTQGLPLVIQNFSQFFNFLCSMSFKMQNSHNLLRLVLQDSFRPGQLYRLCCWSEEMEVTMKMIVDRQDISH